MPIQTDNIAFANNRQELIAAVDSLEIDNPVTILLNRPSGITIYHFSGAGPFSLHDRIANIQKQIRKIPRQAFL